MAVTVTDVLKANLVLVGVELLRGEEQFKVFRTIVDTEVTIAPGPGLLIGAPSDIPLPGHILSLNRDRIVLELSPSRSTINRDYPSKEGWDRLAKVAWHAIATSDLTDQQLRAYGYNIELVYEQNSGLPALRYLGERLFQSALFSDIGWESMGGSGKLNFMDDEERWQVLIEPRLNDAETTKIFLSLNLHKQEQTLPTEENIQDSLKKIEEQAQRFINLLDKSV